MGDHARSTPASLSDVPVDELIAYAHGLGLSVAPDTARGELLRVIRERQELLLELDRDALLDVVAWARVPVRRSAGKEELARHIADIHRLTFEGLSERGMRALARLWNADVASDASRADLERALRRTRGWRARLRQRRRSWLGATIARAVERPVSHADDYKFLPEEPGKVGLQARIEDAGLVGGIAQKLRGAADHYVAEKLDEIERRIDRKLDEIDGRLSEWRDREIVHRLRLVKITLITAIVVAFVSLGYHYLQSRRPATAAPEQPAAAAQDDQRAGTSPSVPG